jgi:IS30 family transposase
LDPRKIRRVLDLLAQGLPLKVVVARSGVSIASVQRIKASVGGVLRPPNAGYDKRYLDREERYELARLLDAGHCQAEVARRLGRPASTVSRELARNRCPRTGRYVPERADRLAWERQRRPKPTKLSRQPALKARAQEMLDQRYSPEQVAGRLRREHPEDPSMWISHETIYRAIYVHARGQLQRELKAQLRTRRTQRRRQGRQTRSGPIVDAISIHDRPAEIETRLIPGHHEGDLIMGTIASRSAVGTIVERTSGFVHLLHLGEGGISAERVAAAVTAQLQAMPAPFGKTLTWDRGREMAAHAKITKATGVQVYFADPYSPYQRGSNENTNGLLRDYFPKGVSLANHLPAHLLDVEHELNHRPRIVLQDRCPADLFAALLASTGPSVLRR